MNYAQEQVSIIGQFSLATAWQNFCQLPRFLNFRPRYSFRLETDQYILTTANGIPQIYGALCLRYQCFIYQNHLLGRFMGLDIDEFDYGCDHIIVIDKKSKWIIGTYRARASSFCQSYYSQGEFELSHFLATGGIKLELGRACILENHRNGAVIDLLWKGIGRYANLCNAQYIFGCSSVKTTDSSQAKLYMEYFRNQGYYSDVYGIRPINQYRRDLSKVMVDKERLQADLQRELPPLLRTYLSGGALVYGEPAFDMAFDCIDFLTIMDVGQLAPSFKRRYFGH